MAIVEGSAVEKTQCRVCKGVGEFEFGLNNKGLEPVECGQRAGAGYVYRVVRPTDAYRTNLYVGLKVAAGVKGVPQIQ